MLLLLSGPTRAARGSYDADGWEQRNLRYYTLAEFVAQVVNPDREAINRRREELLARDTLPGRVRDNLGDPYPML